MASSQVAIGRAMKGAEMFTPASNSADRAASSAAAFT